MASYMDASTMNSDDLYDNSTVDYPTPGSFSESCQSVEPEQHQQQPKKKRKAWGQPVPEINPILPPRKRAKTAEEKEQRKNERILRNRRAADKSRQRQKAEVEALRTRQLETEAENAQLKNILAQYQSQYGKLPGCEFNPQISTSEISSLPLESLSIPTPLSLNDTINSSDFSHCTDAPAFSPITPGPSLYHDSPALAPTLNLGEATMYPSSLNVTGMTQYPAVSASNVDVETSIITAQPSVIRSFDYDPLSANVADVFGENFAVTDLQTFDGNPFEEFGSARISRPDQFSLDPYFDYDAFNGESNGSFPLETSEQTSCLQSQPSASLGESSRPDFAAAV